MFLFVDVPLSDVVLVDAGVFIYLAFKTHSCTSRDVIKAVPADEVSLSVHFLSVFPSENQALRALQSRDGAQLFKNQHPAAAGDLVLLIGLLLCGTLVVLCSIGDWLCEDEPTWHPVLTQHRVELFGHVSLFYLMGALGCWPQIFLFRDSHIDISCMGKNISTSVWFGGFDYSEEGLFFFFFPIIEYYQFFWKGLQC